MSKPRILATRQSPQAVETKLAEKAGLVLIARDQRMTPVDFRAAGRGM